MLPRLHRPLAALIPVLFLGLAACGSDDGGGPTDIDGPEGFAAVEIAGEPGAQPDVTWKGQMKADGLEVETLAKGDGDEIADGDTVLTNLWVGNGFTKAEAYSTYGEEGGGAQSITIDAEELAPVFMKAFVGQTHGSRVAVVGSAKKAFGEGGQPSLGIGDGDTVLLIADIAGEPLQAPQGAAQDPPRWAPSLKETKKGVVTGLRFRGVPAPAKRLRSFSLIEGDGAKVQSGQSITVNYLGQVYQGAKPFDESFSKEPASFQIGIGGVIKGWDEALVGVPIGSRVVLSIPPSKGYGKAGNKDAGIKGTDTLFFVVDVLGAA